LTAAAALAIASISGHLAVVNILLEKGADVNALSIRPKDCTPIMGAADAGHTEVVQTLKSHGADLSVIPDDGVTTLEGAMEKGHLDTVKVLLEAIGGLDYPTESVALQMALARSQPTMRSLMTTVSLMYPRVEAGSSEFAWMTWVLDQGGELVRPRALHNMLQATLFDGQVSMVEELLKLGANPNDTVFTGDRPLHVAVGLRNKDLVRILLHAGADPALPSRDDKNAKLTPFHQALIFLEDDVEKDTAIVDMLLASGRCKLMEGEDLRSTAFSFIVRRLDRWENGLAESIVERMLDSISDVDGDRSDDGSTLMHVAVHYRASHLVDILLEKGADINAKDKSDHTPFLLAHQSKRHFLDFLVTRGADPFAVNEEGQGVLHLAAIHGNTEAIDSLLDLDLAEGEAFEIDAVDHLGHTALISAIAASKEEAALHLLEYGAATISRTTDKGRIVLHYAARASMHRIVEKLVADSSSVNTQDDKGWTPLALACTASSPTLIRFLLSQGADPEIPNHAGDRPIHIALKRPLHRGPRDRRWGDPALELINLGVDITAADAEGHKPLYLAAQFHNLSAARLLLAKSASPKEVDNKGQTPLSVCSSPKIAEALIEAGANINHVEDNGYTPLHHAVDGCWVKTFKVLVDAGADLHAKTREEGLDVQERIDKLGGWREWTFGEHDVMCRDIDRENERVAVMEGEW
jgi:ankyrin repeat protein